MSDVLKPLGETVEFRDEVAIADLNRTFNAQRAAILDLNQRIEAGKATEAERAERIAKMEGDLAEALRADKAGRREVFVASGTANDVDLRYIRDDGTLRLRTEKVAVPGPDGSPIHTDLPGLLDDRSPASADHADLRNAFHRYKMAQFLAAKGLPSLEGTASRVWATEVVPAMKRMSGSTGAFLRTMLSNPEMFKRVLNGTTGTGGDLISNPTMGVRRPTSMPRVVSALFRRQMVANKTFTPAVTAGRGLPRLRTATGVDPARFTPQSFTTTTASVSVKDFNIQALVDSNWFRDVAPVADGLQLVLDWLDQAEADGIEIMLLHGDTAATHQDSGIATWTLDSYFASGQLDGTDSPIKQWLGLRARSADDSTTTSGGGSFTLADLTVPSASLKTWDSGSVLLAGLNGIYTISATSEFNTTDVFGQQAMNVAGAVGSIAGKRVYISEFLPREFSTSTGMYTGSNPGNLLIQVNPAAGVIYEMESPEADYDVSEPHRGARYIGRNMSAVFAFDVATGEKPVAVLYNIG